ncbi:MAG: bifunctional oligoribonuclease/PAP phosphatase NrnA [Epsilonproteobacteria bacterium]|nr:bifunctional oligoribonuclease/PAP phosphatase NrnA [Campylobacterota bacterium]NPA88994.1 bifunctional oligoribonuclease/PAP phosphatase NrnA [Campylobacterota bacterium]
MDDKTFRQIWKKLMESDKITIIPHLNPDGDALGSGLGLYWTLKKLGKKVKIYNKTTPLPYYLDFLPGFDQITNQYPKDTQVVVSVDCGDFDRLGIEERPPFLINIDHHYTNPNFGDLNLVDRGGPATAYVVYQLLKRNRAELTPEGATGLYTGILTDTGNFQYETVTGDLFRAVADLVDAGANPGWIGQMLYQRDRLSRLRLLAKILDNIRLLLNGKVAFSFATQKMFRETGATKEDTETISSQLRNIGPVEIGLFLREEEDGSVKVSLRSKEKVDVGKISVKLGGGGHARAAGATLPNTSIEEALKIILPLIEKELKATGVLEESTKENSPKKEIESPHLQQITKPEPPDISEKKEESPLSVTSSPNSPTIEKV